MTSNSTNRSAFPVPMTTVVRKLRIPIAMALLISGLVAFSFLNTRVSGAVSVANSGATLDAQLFASQIETMGSQQYSSTFAGTQFQPGNSVTIYASSVNSTFVAAVAALDSGGFTYNVVVVPLNVTQLESEVNSVSADIAQFLSAGLMPTELNPNAATGQVDLTLASPTSAAINELNSAIENTGDLTGAPSVTLTNYVVMAQQYLSTLFGNEVQVQSAFRAAAVSTSATQLNDDEPWTGSDPITGPSGCTSGFGVIGNASGNDFVLTAGHCGEGSWYTSAGGFIGNTSAGGLHFLDSYGNDYQTILTEGARGRVWYDNTQYHPILGYLIPSVGDDITFDGADTGEVPGSLVTATDATVDLYNEDGVYQGTIKHQIVAGNSVPVCQYGDSGGPMYQRISGSSSVYAVGIMNSCYFQPDGVGTGLAGTGERIDDVLSESNSSLIIG